MIRNNGRNTDGTFGPGNPGKPRGARHKATTAALTLLDGQAEALTQKAIETALTGDTTALRLCLDRIAPPRRDAPISFAIPPITTAKDAATAAGAILDAVALGNVTPLEAAQVMGLIETYRRTLETCELEARVTALEAGAA
jgi:hypothetical protein